MFAKIIASRWTPIVIAIVAFMGLFGLYRITDNQLTAAQATVTAQKGQIGQLQVTLKTRDDLIAQQNAGILAISGQRAEDRVIYLKNYAAADERAKDDDARASAILALPNEHIDELAQCRASRALLEQELVN